MSGLHLADYISFSVTLFFLGVWGVIAARKNLIVILVSIEMILLAVNLNVIIFSVYLDDVSGQVLALLTLTIAAAESAIGLALLVVYYRVKGNINIDYISTLKG